MLYVEDDDATYALVRLIMRDEEPQIRLLRASDGEQALAILRRSPPFEEMPVPDLILLDWNLPKKNGFELLADLKHSEEFRSIPVVMFTTSSSRSDRNDSLALGAQSFVTKPATFDAFVTAVKMACLEEPKSFGSGGGK